MGQSRTPGRREALVLLAAAAAGVARAQPFPARPLTLLVGFPAGGVFDGVMRSAADEMGKALGQRVNVDNRAGAGGALATQLLVSARPDGYTLLAAGLQLATAPHLNTVGYDPQTDLAMVGQLARVPVLLLARGDSPLRSAADLVALAGRRGAAGISVGSGGVGTTGHFAALMLGEALKLPALHVPFKGGAAGLQGLAGGEVDLMFDQPSGAMQGLLQGGRVRVLSVMQNQRLATLPQAPTAAEFGLPLAAPLQGWQGLAVRSGTPAPVLARLAAAWATAAGSPAVQARLLQLGLEPDLRGADAAQQHYLAELRRWGEFIKTHRITAS